MARSTPKQIQTLSVGEWTAERQEADGWKVRDRLNSRVFTLYQEQVNRWRVRGKNFSGERQQKRFQASGLEEAIFTAAEFLHPVSGELVPEPTPRFTLAEAFDRALSNSRAGDEFLGVQFRFAGYFCDWAAKQGISHWQQIRFSHIEGYARFLQRAGKARKTICNYLNPVRMTATYLHRDFPEDYHNAGAGYRLPLGWGAAETLAEKRGREALTLEEVLTFADWLKDHRWGRFLRPGVLLGGLLGMRVREAAYLTWGNVDLRHGTLTIEAEQGHKVKNEESLRLLPLPSIVVQALAEVPRTSERVLDVDLHRTCCEGRKPTPPCRYYADRLTEAIREWKPGSRLCAKELRNTIQTTALDDPQTWNVHLVDRFVGHAPVRMNERHYYANNPQRLLKQYRDQIIPLLEGVIAEHEEGSRGTKWHAPVEVIHRSELQMPQDADVGQNLDQRAVVD